MSRSWRVSAWNSLVSLLPLSLPLRVVLSRASLPSFVVLVANVSVCSGAADEKDRRRDPLLAAAEHNIEKGGVGVVGVAIFTDAAHHSALFGLQVRAHVLVALAVVLAMPPLLLLNVKSVAATVGGEIAEVAETPDACWKRRRRTEASGIRNSIAVEGVDARERRPMLAA